MKLLQIKISRCFGCPYFRTPSDDRVKLDWCYKAGKLIEDNLSIVDMPDWCPLPEAQREANQ